MWSSFVTDNASARNRSFLDRLRVEEEGDHATQMYEVRSAGAKGLGVFATSKILRGTRIFSERPTLTITAKQDIDSGDIYTVFRSLSAVDQASILQLSAHVTSPFLRWTHVLWYTTKELFTSFSIPRVASIRQHKSVLSIFRTNSFAIGGKSTIQQAIFARIARLNHSCVPNCQGNFDESRLCFNIHSTRDIEPQEELNISYLPEHGATHASRQANLTPAYGFECECPACDLSSTRGKDGEARRKQMQTDLAAFVERVGKGTETSPDMELGTIQKYIQLFEDEGIAGRELSTMYHEAAKICEKLGKNKNAIEYAEVGLRLDRHCLGIDHPIYDQGEKVLKALHRRGKA